MELQTVCSPCEPQNLDQMCKPMRMGFCGSVVDTERSHTVINDTTIFETLESFWHLTLLNVFSFAIFAKGQT